VEELELDEDVPESDGLVVSPEGVGFVEGLGFAGCWFWDELEAGDSLLVGEGGSFASGCCGRLCCESGRVEEEVATEEV
jgi:hypothetical protein